MTRGLPSAAAAPREVICCRAFVRWWQPGWPPELEAAYIHPIAGPLLRAGAYRLQREETRMHTNTNRRRQDEPAAPLQPAAGDEGSQQRLDALFLLSRHEHGLTLDQISGSLPMHDIDELSAALVALLDANRVTRISRGGMWVWRVTVPATPTARAW